MTKQHDTDQWYEVGAFPHYIGFGSVATRVDGLVLSTWINGKPAPDEFKLVLRPTPDALRRLEGLPTFEQALEYVLDKNEELLRRLA